MTTAEVIKEALKTTVFGMGLVLGTLFLLSLILDLMREISYKNNGKGRGLDKNRGQDEIVESNSHDVKDEKEDEAELIAVITAALSDHMGKPLYQIKVNSIRQIHTKTPVWGLRSRLNNLNNKL